MRFVIVLAIISTIINIVSYFIEKKEVEKIRINFKQIRYIYDRLKRR